MCIRHIIHKVYMYIIKNTIISTYLFSPFLRVHRGGKKVKFFSIKNERHFSKVQPIIQLLYSKHVITLFALQKFA